MASWKKIITDGLTLSDIGTPASDDKVLIQDTDDNNTIKYVDFGDFDGSGAVEVADLLDLLSTFGNACAECATDLDGDGSVQVSDLLNLLSVCGATC